MRIIRYNFQQLIRLLCQIVVDKRVFNLPGLFRVRMIVYRLLFKFGTGCFIGEHVFFDREHRKFDESLYIGTRTVILASCNRIGKNSRIGACSVVKNDVPDNVLVAGVPAKVIKQLDN